MPTLNTFSHTNILNGPRIGITAVGHYFPENLVTTNELEGIICRDSGFSVVQNGLFEKLTGIRSRRIADPAENSSDLAAKAAKIAFERHNIDPNTVDLLLFASASRDFVEPATAHVVQDLLGTNAHVLDVTNACNSFMNGIDIARAMIVSGRAKKVLVCSGEIPTRAMRTKVSDQDELYRSFAGYTFGDAGAAVVMEVVNTGGFIAIDALAYSQHWKIGGIFGGGTRHPREVEHTYFHGDGDLLRGAFEGVGTAPVEALLTSVGISLNQIDRVFCHQVTMPYLRRFLEVLAIDPSKVLTTVETYGNLASCSIPVQISLSWDLIKPGERTLLVGLGGGASLALAVWER